MDFKVLELYVRRSLNCYKLAFVEQTIGIITTHADSLLSGFAIGVIAHPVIGQCFFAIDQVFIRTKTILILTNSRIKQTETHFPAFRHNSSF